MCHFNYIYIYIYIYIPFERKLGSVFTSGKVVLIHFPFCRVLVHGSLIA